MTRTDAAEIAAAVRDALSPNQRTRLKAIHVNPRLHDGMLTIRVFMTSEAAAEPEHYVFEREILS